MSVPRAADRGCCIHAASSNSRLLLWEGPPSPGPPGRFQTKCPLGYVHCFFVCHLCPRAAHAGHTELSFTKPRTESSCRESWLARPSKCMVRLCAKGLPAPSILGGEGASSGVRNWWPPCSSFRGIMSESVASVARLGMEEGGVG